MPQMKDHEINEATTGIDVYFTYIHRYYHINNSSGLSN